LAPEIINVLKYVKGAARNGRRFCVAGTTSVFCSRKRTGQQNKGGGFSVVQEELHSPNRNLRSDSDDIPEFVDQLFWKCNLVVIAQRHAPVGFAKY
jgi:hypothetical protein